MKFPLNAIVVSCFAFVASSALLCHPSMGQTPSQRNGAGRGNIQKVWKFDLPKKFGPGITFEGNTISLFSSLICVKSDWTDQYFWTLKHPFLRQSTPSSAAITSDPKAPTAFVLNQLKFEAVNATTMRITADGSLNQHNDGLVEYIPLVIPAALMEGASVINERGEKTIIGKDTVQFKTRTRRLIIKSRFGSLVITSKGGSGLTLSDRRTKKYQNRAVFLVMADAGRHLKKGERFHHAITLSLPDGLTSYDAPSLVEITPRGGSIVPLDSVAVEAPARVAGVFPNPRDQAFTNEIVALPSVVGIAVKNGGDRAQYVSLLNELLEATGASCTASEDAPAFITIKTIDPVAADKYDYYEITIAPDGVVIGSPTPQGAYYAMSTLVQMRSDQGTLRAGVIKDWADFAFRGLHLLGDDASLKLHSLLIKNVLGPLKFNHIVFECEYVKWPSHPEIHQPWGMTTQDVKALVKLAKDHYIEVTPLLQTYGHSNYLFANNSNRDIAEDPQKPYAYNVSNPRTYEVIGDLLGDIRDAFPASKFLHIGHDEVTLNRTYPTRPENMHKSLGELLWTDLQFYQNYAKRKTLSLMIWQDYLNGRSMPSHRDELLSVAKKMDKSDIITVWNYKADKKQFKEIDQFQDLGFRVIGATGEEDVSNITTFAQYAKTRHIMGMLHTTWTGYGGNAVALYRYYKKLWPYIQAGVSFWNVNAPVVSHATPSYATRMRDRVITGMYPRKYFLDHGIATPLDLSAVANVSLAERGGFQGGKLTTSSGMVFTLATSKGSAAAVKVEAARPLVIPVGRKIKAISFLFTNLDSVTKMHRVGTITVVGDHGFVQPIVVNREINNMITKLLTPGGRETGQVLGQGDSQQIYPIAQPVFSGKGRYVLWQYDMAVEESMVRSVKITVPANASLVVAAVTLVE